MTQSNSFSLYHYCDHFIIQKMAMAAVIKRIKALIEKDEKIISQYGGKDFHSVLLSYLDYLMGEGEEAAKLNEDDHIPFDWDKVVDVFDKDIFPRFPISTSVKNEILALFAQKPDIENNIGETWNLFGALSHMVSRMEQDPLYQERAKKLKDFYHEAAFTMLDDLPAIRAKAEELAFGKPYSKNEKPEDLTYIERYLRAVYSHESFWVE